MDFKLCLKGPTLEEDFRSYYPTTVNDMKIAGSFDASLKTWLKDACFSLDAFCRKKQWMVQLSRPYTMMVLDFANQLQTMNRLLGMIPHDDESQSVVDDADLKLVFFKAMPMAWQQDFELQGKTLDDDYCTIVNFFVTQQTIKDTQRVNGEGIHKQKPEQPNGGGDRDKKKRINARRQQDGNNKMATKVFVGPCPVHPGAAHT